jgi:hypothetical protein
MKNPTPAIAGGGVRTIFVRSSLSQPGKRADDYDRDDKYQLG